METLEKQLTYTTTNVYETLNRLTESTKTVWIVLHGIGFLSRYFLRYFDELPARDNYIIAPQAPSKYYLNGAYKHVGASWLTKENTSLETKNIMAYLDAVYEAERIPEHCKLIVFGFSQGVSVATRWVAKRQLKCEQLVLYAGGIPDELVAEDFAFLEENNTRISVLVGDNDKYLTPKRLEAETEKISVLFHGRAEQIRFKGGHEIKKDLLKKFL